MRFFSTTRAFISKTSVKTQLLELRSKQLGKKYVEISKETGLDQKKRPNVNSFFEFEELRIRLIEAEQDVLNQRNEEKNTALKN